MGELVLFVVSCVAFLVVPVVVGGVLYVIGRDLELKARASRSRTRP